MTPPPIYTHACDLYQAFLTESFEVGESEARDYGVRPGDRMFVGHWSTHFRNRPDLPGESTQQKAFAFLQSIGCLEVLRRGGRDYPGVIVLHREPTTQDAEAAPADSRELRNGKLGVVETAVNAHTGRISDLEEAVEVLSGQHDALVRDVELQLRKLSARMDDALKAREQQ